jgi:hypothetical protein
MTKTKKRAGLGLGAICLMIPIRWATAAEAVPAPLVESSPPRGGTPTTSGNDGPSLKAVVGTVGALGMGVGVLWLAERGLESSGRGAGQGPNLTILGGLALVVVSLAMPSAPSPDRAGVQLGALPAIGGRGGNVVLSGRF